LGGRPYGSGYGGTGVEVWIGEGELGDVNGGPEWQIWVVVVCWVVWSD